jgi:tetratricopeptide (TPR) repeat protein
MQIDVIDNFKAFTELRNDWEAVYDADAEAKFFLSWTWMSNWLEKLDKWFILGARPSADSSAYVAFFPLSLRVKVRKDIEFYNEIGMAGRKAAEYTGFICRPEAQEEAIPAFAKRLTQLNWANLDLEYIAASQERLRLFLKQFSQNVFDIKDRPQVNKQDNTNLLVCPCVQLPGDWDTYLEQNLGSETRRTIKRFMKQIDNSDEFRITHTDANTVERDVKILLDFWTAKWAPRKGDRLAAIVNGSRANLMRAFEGGFLFLPVFWKGNRPLGAQATFVDSCRKSMLCCMGARDETFGKPSPGVVLHAHSIHYAINNGFTTYDFLRGNEPYKYSFGAKDFQIRRIEVRTKNGRNLGLKLDSRSLGAVLRRSVEFHEAGRLNAAERGYRQILDVAPRSVNALYGLAQLLALKGEHGAAEKSFRALLAITPNVHKAWLKLGKSLQARGQFAAAADAYREVTKRWPELPLGFHNLGHTLVKVGQFDAAIVAFDTALGRIKSDLIEIHYGRGLALQAKYDIDGAVECFRKVLELQPEHREVLTLLSNLGGEPSLRLQNGQSTPMTRLDVHVTN